MGELSKPEVLATVTVLIDSDERVILARKKQAIHHDSGEIEYSLGLYNGYGGKMDEGDLTILDTALRELIEETGITAKKEDLKREISACFYVSKDGSTIPFMEVVFFSLRQWQGEPAENDEMGPPEYFAPDALPYNEMMPADKILFEKIFRGEGGEYDVFLKGKGATPEVRTRTLEG